MIQNSQIERLANKVKIFARVNRISYALAVWMVTSDEDLQEQILSRLGQWWAHRRACNKRCTMQAKPTTMAPHTEPSAKKRIEAPYLPGMGP